MSDFGDFDPDDAVDHEPADPEQVGRRLHGLIAYLRNEVGVELPEYDELEIAEKFRLLNTGNRIINWLAAHADNPEQLARDVHEYRRTQDPDLPEWDDTPEDARDVAIALMAAIVEWLQGQGAI
jgi:hypothetical protein